MKYMPVTVDIVLIISIFVSLIFLPVTMKYMGYNKFIKSILITAGITLFVYILFVKLFEIQLPEATIIFGAAL